MRELAMTARGAGEDSGAGLQYQMSKRWHYATRVMGAVIITASLSGAAIAESEFPFNLDLMLDARPMKGSKRVPVIEIDDDGVVVIDLWCDSVQGQATINGDSITITTGQRTDRGCPADRAAADNEVIDALQQVTGWRRSGSRVEFTGPRTLNFRLPTN
jgi:heat shock protein HslJ